MTENARASLVGRRNPPIAELVCLSASFQTVRPESSYLPTKLPTLEVTSVVRTINLSLDENEYVRAFAMKGKRTWKQVLLDGLQREREDVLGLEHSRQFVVKRVTVKPIEPTTVVGKPKHAKKVGRHG